MKRFIFSFLVLLWASTAGAQIITVDQNTKDTIIITTRTITPAPYQTAEVTRRPYKPPTETPTPAPTGILVLPVSNPLVFNDRSDFVIENIRIENAPGVAIELNRCKRVRIKNVYINGTGINSEAIELENCNDVTVENSLIGNAVTGVYAVGGSGIKVINNEFFNVRQRTIGARGQFVQFDGVTGAGNAIENNKGENWLGESDPEDLISLFRSSGTQASPIYVRNNMFRGGGPSASGGGIMSGDNGGSWQVIENNTLLDPGQYGIAAASGQNIQLINNKIFAKQQSFTNNPLYVWKQSETACGPITVKGNRVNWTDAAGKKNNGWNAGNCPNVSFEYPTTITLAEMNVPAHLFTRVTPDELLKKVRRKN